MKKLTAMLSVAVALALTAAPAFAEDITISGSVPSNAVTTITPAAGYDSLDLGTDQSAGVNIASVNEKCNKAAGYTVTLQTANGTTTGVLVGAVDGDTLNYDITYGGAAVTLVAGSATVTDASAKTGGQGVDKDLDISYNADPVTGTFLAEDTYSDTLTLTLTAK